MGQLRGATPPMLVPQRDGASASGRAEGALQDNLTESSARSRPVRQAQESAPPVRASRPPHWRPRPLPSCASARALRMQDHAGACHVPPHSRRQTRFHCCTSRPKRTTTTILACSTQVAGEDRVDPRALRSCQTILRFGIKNGEPRNRPARGMVRAPVREEVDVEPLATAITASRQSVWNLARQIRPEMSCSLSFRRDRQRGSPRGSPARGLREPCSHDLRRDRLECPFPSACIPKAATAR